jgi:diaminopimelate decarboxylase
VSTIDQARGASEGAPVRRDAAGALLVEEVSAAELAAVHGTPLHVISTARLRESYRRFRQAFEARWAGPVQVLYATKANPALAIRRVMTQEGAGGDCLGLHELRAALMVGTPGETIVVNGFNKPDDAIEAANRAGARLNVDDDADEPARIAAIAARVGRTARVGIRLKPTLTALSERPSNIVDTSVGTFVEVSKWGLEEPEAIAVIRELRSAPSVELVGLHCHIGRHVAEPALFAEFGAAIAAMVAGIGDATGWTPSVLAMGGGFAQGRDPFYRRPEPGGRWPREDDRFVAPVEEYAEALCASLEAGIPATAREGMALELEPGRYIASDAVLTLATVGTVKETRGRRYVGIDATGAQLGLSRSPRDAHVVVPVQAGPGDAEPCDVVGPLCVLDVVMEQGPLPPVARGDLLAVLDTGAYADGEASNANSIGRPACVLVDGATSSLVRRRETFGDIFGRDAIPVGLC